jgi:precorrin-6B methylase 2
MSVHVVYLPTTEEAVHAMLTLADVKDTDVVCDLGCGDGRILVAAAKDFGARAIGVDIDAKLIAQAKANAAAAGVGHLVQVEEKDLFDADLSGVTVLTLFMLANVNVMLLPKLVSELRPGTRIVCNTFGIEGWPVDKEATVGEVEDEDHHVSHKLYLYTVPEQSEPVHSHARAADTNGN